MIDYSPIPHTPARQSVPHSPDEIPEKKQTPSRDQSPSVCVNERGFITTPVEPLHARSPDEKSVAHHPA